MVCRQQVDLKNELQQHQAQVANLTAENRAIQEQSQEQVANLTAENRALQYRFRR